MNAVNVGLVTFIIQHNRIQGVFLLCKITNLLIYSILYIFCVLLPLIITDSVVFLIIRNSEMEKQKHDMTNIANAVSYNISSVVNNAGEMAKTIYTSRYIDDFLSRKYDTSAQYIMEYQEFFKDTLLENLLGMNQIVFTMYTNNDTIVKGGKVGNIEDLKET